MEPVPPPALAAVVLAVVLLVGVVAGRSKRRWTLLVVGVLAAVLLGAVLSGALEWPGDDPGARITQFYRIVVPLAMPFVAGWLIGRGSWLWRFVVIAAAVLLLAAFPYEAAGRATAEVVFADPAPEAFPLGPAPEAFPLGPAPEAFPSVPAPGAFPSG